MSDPTRPPSPFPTLATVPVSGHIDTIRLRGTIHTPITEQKDPHHDTIVEVQYFPANLAVDPASWATYVSLWDGTQVPAIQIAESITLAVFGAVQPNSVHVSVDSWEQGTRQTVYAKAKPDPKPELFPAPSRSDTAEFRKTQKQG